MRSPKSHFRFFVLCGCILATATVAAHRLVKLHFQSKEESSAYTGEVRVNREHIPAQRGIIMDRNEEILTNNIQSCDLMADRYHLRDIAFVIDALGYNQAIHDAAWQESSDKQREALIKLYRAKLKSQAKRSLSDEEKAERRRQAAQNVKMEIEEYKSDMRDLYFDLHDQLVAELIYPHIKHQSIEVGKDSSGRPMRRAIQKEDIIAMIAQKETIAYNNQAREQGKPTRSLRQEFALANGLSQDQAHALRTSLKKYGIRGLVIQMSPKRSYAEPEHLAHVVGFVNSKNVGVSGIEARYQYHLSGVPGLREYRNNSQAKNVPHIDDRYLPARPGLNVQLTIDMRIQSIVEEELDRGLREFESPRGCIIVVDPKTGDILAMASRPSFNLNTKDVITPAGHISRVNTLGPKGSALTGEFNFATQARYEPGSTFKVIAMAAALDKNKITLETPINTSPIAIPGGKPVNDGRYNYGILPAWAVMKKSSNPGTVNIARTVGWQVFRDYMDAFGVTKSMKLDISNGGGCQVADASKPINFSRLAFGYSINLSPLHMAMVYATIANDGKHHEPRLVNKIIDSSGNIFDDCPPGEGVPVIKPRTARQLRQALVSVTEKTGKHGRGTATLAAIPGFKIAGKTGTAKKVKEGGGGYHESLYTVSFAGMIPADKPELVIMTVIDEPLPHATSGVGGGTVAAPIFRAVAERLVELLHIIPEDPVAYREYREKQQKTATTSP